MTEKQKEALTIINSLPINIQEQINKMIDDSVSKSYFYSKQNYKGDENILTTTIAVWASNEKDNQILEIILECTFIFSEDDAVSKIVEVKVLTIDEWLDKINELKKNNTNSENGGLLCLKNGE